MTDVSAKERWQKPAAGDSSSGQPEVVFTFDDGPHEKYTPMILDELEARGIQGIFFWVGHRVSGKTSDAQDARLAVVERAIEAGHLVGNHTVNHARLCNGSEETAGREIDENAKTYEKLTGLPMSLFRAPYGNHCDRLIEMLDERGIEHLHWDIDPHEYLHHNSKKTAETVIGKLKRLEGRGVVLMHDTKVAAARALPLILDWIEQENARRALTGEKTFRIVSGSELISEKLDPNLPRLSREIRDAAFARLSQSLANLVPGVAIGDHGPVTARDREHAPAKPSVALTRR
jgi:peptidoglycan/xylan/chitin deacetylase (PgdA/CDA1 family)